MISFQDIAQGIPDMIEEQDDEKIHSDPSTSTNGDQCIFNKQPFWKCDTLEGMISF
jgi:hypothetical protein